MAKFKKNKSEGSTGISTASLPDIVFMLLFFFMVTTKMRDVSVKVKNVTPAATELEKLTKKTLVSYIYVGSPIESLQSEFGTATRIQLNDAYKSKEDIRKFIEEEREKLPEYDKEKMMVSLKGDREVKMGIITDIKQELRKSNALKLTYSAKRRGENERMN
jgi:biopolymer transport protein ExbD